MLPFRAFDKETKTTWVVLNYQPGENGGHYLVAREDDSQQDGAISLLAAKDMLKLRLVEVFDDEE
jgi:hypothetical protein